MWPGLEDGRVVVQVDHVAVDGDCRGERRYSTVRRLNHQDVVLHLRNDRGSFLRLIDKLIGLSVVNKMRGEKKGERVRRTIVSLSPADIFKGNFFVRAPIRFVERA